MRLPPRGILAAVALGICAFAFMLIVWHGRPTAFDNYVYLADAWHHGRNWIAFPGDRIDAMPYHGRAYVIEAPFPAMLAYPFVLLFGLATNQTLLSNLVGGIAVFAAWRLCQNIGLGRRESFAATAFFFFGTSLFVCSTTGSVWYLGHVAAAAASLLALAEYFGKRRAWLVAVWALAAAYSRYPLFAALPFYLGLLLVASRPPARVTLSRFVTPIVPAMVAWVLYNYTRWKTLTDPGYSLFYRVMDEKSLTNPEVFALWRIPEQLGTLLLQAPVLTALPPWISPSTTGLGILYTSLPFAYAMFAGLSLETVMLWALTAITTLSIVAYYGSGDIQFGERHALDFEPFVFALLLLALKRRPSRHFATALLVFAGFGLYESIVWLFFSGVA